MNKEEKKHVSETNSKSLENAPNMLTEDEKAVLRREYQEDLAYFRSVIRERVNKKNEGEETR